MNDSTDLIGYERFIELIETRTLLSLRGDLLEIGTLLGGGAAKLARMLRDRRSDKKLIVVDVFDFSADQTINEDGLTMPSCYLNSLRNFPNGETQRDVFDRQVAGLEKHLTVVVGDSRKVGIPARELCFAVVDGCHDPEHVKSDFRAAWDRLVPGGVLALHDYAGDLPQVTAAIEAAVELARPSIEKFEPDANCWMLYLTKGRPAAPLPQRHLCFQRRRRRNCA